MFEGSCRSKKSIVHVELFSALSALLVSGTRNAVEVSRSNLPAYRRFCRELATAVLVLLASQDLHV